MPRWLLRDWSSRSRRSGVTVGAVSADISAAPTAPAQKSFGHDDESGVRIDIRVPAGCLSIGMRLADVFIHLGGRGGELESAQCHAPDTSHGVQLEESDAAGQSFQ